MFGKKRVVLVAGLAVAMGGCASSPEAEAEPPQLRFVYTEIDSQHAGRLGIGDIDGDGHRDIVLHTWSTDRGKVSDGSISWYRYPEWSRAVIKDNDHIFGDGVVVVDIDGDRDLDVVTAKGNDSSAQVWWFENPGGEATTGWKEYRIAEVETESEVKDIYVHDMDGDGKQDVIVRTKHFFALYFQDQPGAWTERALENRQREGMTLADLDGDGDYDAVMNGFWRENPSDPRQDPWTEHVIDELWYTDATGGWQDHSVRATVADFNGDGKADVAFSHSEKTGFHIAWYETADPRSDQPWVKHVIDVVDYCHTLQAADMDNDGDADLLAATLKRTEAPKILILLNGGQGMTWERHEVADKSAYKARAADIDDDGDLDILTSLSWEDPPIMLWRSHLAN